MTTKLKNNKYKERFHAVFMVARVAWAYYYHLKKHDPSVTYAMARLEAERALENSWAWLDWYNDEGIQELRSKVVEYRKELDES